MRIVVAIAAVGFLGLADVAASGQHGHSSGHGHSRSSGSNRRTSSVARRQGHHHSKSAGSTKKAGSDKSKGPQKKGGLRRGILGGVAKNPQVGADARGALNTALSGGFLSDSGRQSLSELIAGNPAHLSQDELEAVQSALDYDAQAKRELRYVRVENATGQPVTLWLRYQTLTDEGGWQWLPASLGERVRSLRYTLQPGTAGYLKSQDTWVAAGRVRVWAESASGQRWLTYRNRDLPLTATDADRTGDALATCTLFLGETGFLAGSAAQARK
jgi:hypothetical protein